MRRLQSNATYSAAGFGALLVLSFLASHTIAAAQNAAAPAPPAGAEGAPDCTRERATPVITDAAVSLSPPRGWQMEGREIELTVSSGNLTADAKPLVCFRWKTKSGKGKFLPVDTVRIVQQLPESKQPPKPATLRFATLVPSLASLGGRPRKGMDSGPPDDEAGEYTPYDKYAPVAEVRILMPGRDDKTIDVMTTVAVVAAQDYCNVPIGQGVRIDSGTIVPSTSKNWQPDLGEIEFTAKTSKTFPTDALIRVCFRWKVTDGEHFVFNDSGPIRILDRQPNSMKLAVGVPEFRDKPPNRFAWPRSGDQADSRIGSYAFLGLAVPLADTRVLVFDNELTPMFDNAGQMGVTSIFLATVLAIAVSAVAFVLLYLVCRQRFPGTRNPLLCVIATPRGFASLSQFQVMLWTFVVMASAVYVIALAGDLIVITPGTLVLLGISGTAAVIAKVKPPPPVESTPAATTAPAGTDATAAGTAVPANARTAGIRQPRWSDLVMEETAGQELDVTRVQMLLFTFVTAMFVATKVITSYEIPDIPEGFLILMGISNGVYVTSKFAVNPVTKDSSGNK